MNEQYSARVYCNEEKIAERIGNDIESLYAWMLTQTNGYFGDVHGEIINIQTQKILRKFRKSAIE